MLLGNCFFWFIILEKAVTFHHPTHLIIHHLVIWPLNLLSVHFPALSDISKPINLSWELTIGRIICNRENPLRIIKHPTTTSVLWPHLGRSLACSPGTQAACVHYSLHNPLDLLLQNQVLCGSFFLLEHCLMFGFFFFFTLNFHKVGLIYIVIFALA